MVKNRGGENGMILPGGENGISRTLVHHRGLRQTVCLDAQRAAQWCSKNNSEQKLLSCSKISAQKIISEQRNEYSSETFKVNHLPNRRPIINWTKY